MRRQRQTSGNRAKRERTAARENGHRSAIPETFGEALTIDTYHGLVEHLCRKSGVEFRPRAKQKGDADFWRDVAPDLLMQACERLDPETKFDAVIVDEGQDFHDLWWTSLDSVFRNPGAKGCYYVFFDPNQNLYVESPAIPGELGPAFELPVNCRNTVRIAEHCAELVNQPNKVRDGAPMGDAPEFVRVAAIRDAFKLAGKRVREWCMPNAGGLKHHQVAVLAPGNTERDWPTDFQTVPLTKDMDAWRNGKGVLIASWARFKGLEADAIVIVETPVDDNDKERANRYVARSRAKHLLYIIQVEK
jgi:DNA helicase IV